MNENIVVFSRRLVGLTSMDVTLCPPARLGDVRRAAEKATTIVFLESLFLQSPSPTHVELLSAIKDGVRLIGGASAGALRAVELSRFGMLGIGHVFNAYSSGAITDDAEVAALLCPITYQYQTIPLVNIRYALRRLADDGFDFDIACKAFIAAQRLHYSHRTIETLLSTWKAYSTTQRQLLLDALRSPENDIKAKDSINAVAFAIRGNQKELNDKVTNKSSHSTFFSI